MSFARIRLRLSLSAVLLALIAAVTGAFGAPPAAASHGQVSMIMDDGALMTHPVQALQTFRQLGVQVVRVSLWWDHVAPARRPAHFAATDPSARGYNWAVYDMVVQDAAQAGIRVDLDVMGGAPPWANGRGAAGHPNWEPNARAYGQFVRAVATRYSGKYTPKGASAPLPRVSFWSIWNEPDYGPSLAPQGVPGHLTIDYAPQMYRNLVDAAWSALTATHHGPSTDTILFGEVAPRGMPYWGVFSGMTPMVFLRSLYCVDSAYHPLRGLAARERGCPTTAAGSRAFAHAHPGLFLATGFSDHPYMRWYSPNHEPSPDPVTHQSTADYATLALIGRLERGLDRVQGAYGYHRHMPVYSTEFGYITSPPKRIWSKDRYPWVNPTTAAYYLNWAEYISWRDPRIASYMQYLLEDPLPAWRSNDYGGYASGLLSYSPNFKGRQKPGYAAWRLPLFLPVTTTRRGRNLEVWGCLRPAHYAVFEAGPQTVQIQSAPGSKPSNSVFVTRATATIKSTSSCYFDQRVTFPGRGTQTVRLVWNYPNPDTMGYFDPLAPGSPIYSRHVQISLR